MQITQLNVFKAIERAGVNIKILTGHNSTTTKAIAKQTEFKGLENILDSEALVLFDDAELQNQVKEVNIYTRMFLQAKLRVINSLKANNEIVTMTGDGVNDAPALKAAHVGEPWGKGAPKQLSKPHLIY